MPWISKEDWTQVRERLAWLERTSYKGNLYTPDIEKLKQQVDALERYLKISQIITPPMPFTYGKNKPAKKGKKGG
jgi:hypothetical protein